MTRRGVLGRWAIVVATTALVGGGCSLIVGFPDRTLGSTDGSGGATASASNSSGMGGVSVSVSASASSGEGGHGGAATTVTSSGSASSSAAGSSASSSTGGATTYCDTLAPQPLFCDDFETHPLTPTWNVKPPTNGTVALSAAQASPLPGQSLEVRLDGGGVPGDNFGHVIKGFFGDYASMHLGFDVYIDQFAGGTENTYLAAIDIGIDLSAFIYANSGATKIQQRWSGNQFGNDLAGAGSSIAPKTWTHVDLALTLVTGGTSKATLTVGSTVVVNDQAMVVEWTTGQPNIRLGDVVLNTTDARAVYYDNVVFEAL